MQVESFKRQTKQVKFVFEIFAYNVSLCMENESAVLSSDFSEKKFYQQKVWKLQKVYSPRLNVLFTEWPHKRQVNMLGRGMRTDRQFCKKLFVPVSFNIFVSAGFICLMICKIQFLLELGRQPQLKNSNHFLKSNTNGDGKLSNFIQTAVCQNENASQTPGIMACTREKRDIM